MKIQLTNQTAELRDESENLCSKCLFRKYDICPYISKTVLDCYEKRWVIIEPADIFTL
jgi:hypothetical protein